MKTYEGRIIHRQGSVAVFDGDRVYRLVHHVHHSPDGHAWGYGGSGPSELAKDMLWDLLDAEPSKELYMAFKRDFLEPMKQDEGFTMTEFDITKWLMSERKP